MSFNDYSCRLCLQQLTRKNRINLGKVSGGFSLAQIYSFTFGFLVDFEQQPNFACQNCESNLLAAFSFKRQCQETEDRLADDLPTIVEEAEATEHFKLEFDDEGAPTEVAFEVDVIDWHPASSTPVSAVTDRAFDFNAEMTSRPLAERLQELDTEAGVVDPYEPKKKIKSRYYRALDQLKRDGHMVVEKPWAKKGPRATDFPRLCEICGKIMSYEAFYGHYQIHPNVGDGNRRRFVCDLCGKSYMTRDYIVVHMRSHRRQLAGEQHICQLCGASLTSEKGLRKHFERVHSDAPKPLGCDMCSTRFRTVSDLNIHKRRHTLDSPHVCEWCKKIFPTRYLLRKHEQTHTGQYKYWCEVCSKGFYARYLRDKHRKTHEKIVLFEKQFFISE